MTDNSKTSHDTEKTKQEIEYDEHVERVIRFFDWLNSNNKETKNG